MRKRDLKEGTLVRLKKEYIKFPNKEQIGAVFKIVDIIPESSGGFISTYWRTMFIPSKEESVRAILVYGQNIKRQKIYIIHTKDLKKYYDTVETQLGIL